VRTFYVADVLLQPHPTAPQAAKVLKVALLAYEDNSNVMMTCDLYGFESPRDFKWEPASQARSVNKEIAPILNVVSTDLVEKIGTNGVIDWQIADLAKRVEEFETSWRLKAFGHALKAYGVVNRLTLEQARLVLEEHYIVSPVMES
jgi:hypothetical protein